MHVSEDDLILHYYGETEAAHVDAHLATCDSCCRDFVRLQQVLALVEPQDVPELSPGFERTVWARLEPELARPRRWFGLALPQWALAGGLAALLLAAFVAGRFTSPVPAVDPAAPAAATHSVAERVFIVAVVDHLDRSQMVLVEMLNADLSDRDALGVEQTRARELVASNRLYRHSAGDTRDIAVDGVLEELERVLVEFANAPADATSKDIEALRTRIASRGLLFKVRVVQSEMVERERRASQIIG